jgi:hypothetical protein
MSETNNVQEQKTIQKDVRREIDAIGWGVFFIWVGLAVLADLGWGVGMIGVGLIILGVFVARTHLTKSTSSSAIQAHF